MEARISPRQLRRLQTLWGLFWKQRLHTEDPESHGGHREEGGPSTRQAELTRSGQGSRDARLGWIGGQVGRQIGSTKELTRAEAEKAIDALQRHLPAELIQHRRMGRREARELGMAGRRGHKSKIVEPPDPQQQERIQNLLSELGWDQRRLEAWLRSRSGPLRGRSQIRTKADANAVAWGLKRILKSVRPAA